ncbi:MAG: DUF2339 domain-containing protein [Opitutus sp.]
MGLVVLLIIFGLLVLVVLPIWVLVKIGSFTTDNEVLQNRLAALEREVQELRQRLIAAARPRAAESTPSVSAAVVRATEIITPSVAPEAPPILPVAPAPDAVSPAVAPVAPPVIPTPGERRSPATKPHAPEPPPLRTPDEPEPAHGISINWEQFMGAKLFAWLGGLAAFLAVAFFVKYSFEHDIIPKEVRVAIGFVLSAALIVGGLLMKPERLRITSQVLCATGVVSLYAVTFACNAVYHFAFFGPVPTFLLMTLVTATAFLLAVRMSAQVIAILGLLGGFLTPILLSTGHDNPSGLFGFIALLDAGLIAVALHRSWFHLVPLAAAGTVLMQIGWASKFFNATKAPIAIVVCLGFCALFFAATEIGRRLNRSANAVIGSSAVMALVAFAFGFYFLTFRSIATQPGWVIPFVFAADLFLLGLVWRNQQVNALQSLAGALAFAWLAAWTASRLTDDLLPWALGAYLAYAVLHTAFPLVLQRARPDTAPGWGSQLYPPLALLLMLGPLLKSDAISLLFWPAVLLLDIVAVALALFTASLSALAVVLVLTLGAMAICIFKATGVDVEFSSLLWVIAGFSVFFFAAGLFVAKRLGSRLQEPSGSRTSALFGGPAAQIPAFSALLPFLLLIMMSQRLPMAVPTPLFGLALLCAVLVLGLSRLLTLSWLPLCGLIGVAALEFAWHARQFDPEAATTPLLWYVAFYALFAIFPFLFRNHFVGTTGPWAVAALSGIAHFLLIYEVVRLSWPNDYLGVLPALFAVTPLVSLALVLRGPADSPHRLNQLAWFGGAGLLFVTLIFPIQFERQWITISWALEGAALLWLFHRVPHPALRATGVVLLVVAFCRLALNREVLAYHPRSDTPLFNWFLYVYGITLVCLFVGALLVAPPRERVLGVNAPPLLKALGTVLAFLLLNIEIADYFSPAGSTLAFEFGGNFARDLAYTVGWALFALSLLAIGMWKMARAARYAALALLSVTMLKLFFHDLAQLGPLYRVGALVVVAAVALLASVLYQRFVPGGDRARSEH